MRKGVYLISVSLLLVVFCVMGYRSPAFAQEAASGANRTGVALTSPGWNRPWGYPGFQFQEQNQDNRSIANRSGNKYARGYNQENTGNNGRNRGYNEDNSGNEANQVINRGALRSGRSDQRRETFSTDSGNTRFFGQWQGDSGNSGDNEGVNRDDSGNLGNQIIN